MVTAPLYNLGLSHISFVFHIQRITFRVTNLSQESTAGEKKIPATFYLFENFLKSGNLNKVEISVFSLSA